MIYAAIDCCRRAALQPLAHLFPSREDQGTVLVNVQLPAGATAERTVEVMKQVEGFVLQQPEISSMVSVIGFSFSGQGQNAGAGIYYPQGLERTKRPGQHADAVAGRIMGAMMGVRDAFIFALSPLLFLSWVCPQALRCACKTVAAWGTMPW